MANDIKFEMDFEKKSVEYKPLYNEKNEKKCSRCQKYYSKNFYTSNGLDINGNIKIRGECKGCRKIINQIRYQNKKEKMKTNKQLTNELYTILETKDDNKLQKLLDDEDTCKFILKILEKHSR